MPGKNDLPEIGRETKKTGKIFGGNLDNPAAAWYNISTVRM